jgi:hypothetical protein
VLTFARENGKAIYVARMERQHEIELRLGELNERWLQHARRGDFESAWCVSDEASALRAGVDCTGWPRHNQFVWRGQDLRGKRILVRCYHGLGDTLQFARFLPRLARMASELTLWAQAPLIPLLRTLPDGPQRIIALHDGAPQVDFDVDLELFEIMHALRISLNDVGMDAPYLLRDIPVFGRETGPLRVGLVWRAGDWNSTRSIDPELLGPLREVQGVQWLLFQRGPGLREWPHDFGRAPPMSGMVAEALEMRRLDLLISVDTCSAHLAGALGVPVWTLLPHCADWRWMQDRSDTLWYPTMTLVRQPRPGDWHSVIAQVATELEVHANERASAEA